MKVGYIRVSTAEQNEARQVASMQEHGVEKLFIDKMSGKDMERPQLQEMLSFVREGDVVIVSEYSRLARSTHDLLAIVEQLAEKRVQFVSLKENIDTSTPAGRLMLTFFAGVAQFEREIMLERQREGIAVAKEQGKYKGRKAIEVEEDAFTKQYRAWKEGKQTATDTMKNLGLKANTFYRRVKEYEAKQ